MTKNEKIFKTKAEAVKGIKELIQNFNLNQYKDAEGFKAITEAVNNTVKAYQENRNAVKLSELEKVFTDLEQFAKKVVNQKKPVADTGTKTAKKKLSSKKASEEKPEEKKPAEEKAEKDGYKNKLFPKTVEIEGVTYTREEQIKSIADLRAFFEKDENTLEYVALCKWSKKDLKQYPYFGGLLPAPKSFPHDFDVVEFAYISSEESNRVAYGLSNTTEAFYTFLNSSFEPTEDNEKFTSGIDFEIYSKPVEAE